MVFVGSGSVSFDTDLDSGSSPAFESDLDPGKLHGFYESESATLPTIIKLYYRIKIKLCKGWIQMQLREQFVSVCGKIVLLGSDPYRWPGFQKLPRCRHSLERISIESMPKHFPQSCPNSFIPFISCLFREELAIFLNSVKLPGVKILFEKNQCFVSAYIIPTYIMQSQIEVELHLGIHFQG